MKHQMLSVVLVVGLAPFVAAQDDNPFKAAKVGDWTSYKLTAGFAGQNIDGDMRMTVTEKDDKTATVEMVATVLGMKSPAQKITIDLTKPYDPSGLVGVGQGGVPKGLDVKKAGEGKEKIKLGDKEYESTWARMTMKGNAQGVAIDGEAKVWIAKAAPLSGMVKMETKMMVMNMAITMKLELSGSGSK